MRSIRWKSAKLLGKWEKLRPGLYNIVGGLEGGNENFALATGEGGVGSWNLLCEYLENIIYKIKK